MAFLRGFLVVVTLLLSLVSCFQAPPCRFSPRHSQQEILNNPTNFVNDILYWEGHFHANNIGYNTANGMSYDGTLINGTTGIATDKHPFSAASKESLQIMVYVHALAGDSRAATFLSPTNQKAAPGIAANILKTKLNTYLKFNQTFPGYGGFLPWFLADQADIQPTSDWVNRVPALDNGELIWSVYAAVQVLESSPNREWKTLAKAWQTWLDYTASNAARIFYNGTGRVCAVADLGDQSLPPNSPSQNYTCEGTGLINDPYEGELFTWWLYFFGGLSSSDKNALWEVKRPQLVNYSGALVTSRHIGPITVQEGFWLSSHEQWKVLELPYFDVSIVKRLYNNAERVRTCNSVLMGRNPGMFASVNNITDPVTGQIPGYISNAGVPEVSNQTVQELDVITPYSVFPTVLFDEGIGLAWYKNMLDGKGMQNRYGSTESERRDGIGISAFVSWDSKITTVNALLGGVAKYSKMKMHKDGIYDEFVKITQREYGRVFGNTLKGENIRLCLPTFSVPVVNVSDFTTCR
ncbi:putative GPI anchored protein [Rhizodiscina lignyota]|uniref:GPI anchored protein n=1 Tax=Rhizodiscina lignyota TaxID=1504668 RepID=A0A9P4I819_9PEZI|nr:putative GPI anchored protein [Rhizodiscina lignyota]